MARPRHAPTGAPPHVCRKLSWLEKLDMAIGGTVASGIDHLARYSNIYTLAAVLLSATMIMLFLFFGGGL